MPSTTTWNPETGLSSVTELVTVKGKTWERTPNYHLIPKADLPINPYNHSNASLTQTLWEGWTKVEKSTGDIVVVYLPQCAYTASTIKTTHDEYYVSSGVDEELPGLRNAAMIDALNKAADTKANLAVSLKEASKTSALILGTAKRILDAVRAFRKGNLREVARQLHLTPKTAHKRWLEYKYGWMPLLLEVKGAAEFLAQQHLGRPPRFVTTGKAKDSFEYDRSYDGLIAGGAPWNTSETLSVEYVVRVRLYLEVTNPHTSALQQLGITNPALYAWEVIPFSFVFDWFCQVGDYLTAISALHGLTVRKSMRDTVDVSRYDMSIPAVANYDDGTYIHSIGGRHSTMKRRNYVREPIGVDTFSLYPPVRLPNSFGKLVTGLALMRASSRPLNRGLRL